MSRTAEGAGARRRAAIRGALAVVLLLAGACHGPLRGLDAERARVSVGAVLDALHAKAAAADFDGYFALYAPEAVFLGTDATERWDLDAFRGYARPHFEAGRGWSYHPHDRRVFLSDGGDVAWFDERLRHERYGELRGTGVLLRRDGAWRVAQYNLAFPVPNDLAPDLVARIAALAAP